MFMKIRQLKCDPRKAVALAMLTYSAALPQRITVIQESLIAVWIFVLKKAGNCKDFFMIVMNILYAML